MLKKLTLLLVFIPAIMLGQRIIKGDVKTIDGPLPGATVGVKESIHGTVTDFNGNFELSVSEKTTTLVISYIGYNTKEIQLTQENNYHINYS